MIELACRVLGYEVRPFTGSDGSPQLFKELIVRADGKILKLKVAKDAPDFASYVDKDTLVILELYSYKDSVNVRATGVAKA